MIEPKITIRTMTYEDVPSVARLEASVFSDPWTEDVYRQTVVLEDVRYVLVLADDEIIGAAGVRNIVGDGEITNVMISPEYRRSGLAYAMLERLLEEGQKLGVIDFTLEVRASNEPAIKLYEKLGFCSEGIRPGFYEHPKEDAVIMWKRNKEEIK